jgi:hypothetical protein
MGLDVANALFGNFHLNWAGAKWLQSWCYVNGLPEPFIGWESGLNTGDPCFLGPGQKHQQSAVDWCTRLEEKFPDLAELGRQLLHDPPKELYTYLYPREQSLSTDEWERRAVAAWYALLQHGIRHNDKLGYF